MKVDVVLSSWFKRYTEGKTSLQVEIFDGTTAIEMFMNLDIPTNEIGFITINNTKQDLDLVLKENDNVRAYPHIVGG